MKRLFTGILICLKGYICYRRDNVARAFYLPIPAVETMKDKHGVAKGRELECCQNSVESNELAEQDDLQLYSFLTIRGRVA